MKNEDEILKDIKNLRERLKEANEWHCDNVSFYYQGAIDALLNVIGKENKNEKMVQE